MRPRGRRVAPAHAGPAGRRGRGARDAGNTTIELVLFMPLLFFAIFVTVQFGLTYLGNSAAQSAAREGARVARTGGDCVATVNQGETRALEILSTVGRGLVESPTATGVCVGDEVTMTVTVQGLSVVPGMPGIEITQSVTGPVESFRADT
jgi:Flp pilus assembly protein TadG